jgi:membrane protein DedA with SNARE-associated domain
MKLFSLVLSVAVFFISLYFLVGEISYGVYTFNEIIYILLLVILMVICITGVIINWNVVSRKKRSNIYLFVSNNFSRKNK